MLNQKNVVDIVKEAKALLYGDKCYVSRALRRFLQRTVPDGVVVQDFHVGEEVLGPKDFATYEACAAKIHKASLEFLPEMVSSVSATHAEPATGRVYNTYPLSISIDVASVAELNDAVHTVYFVGKSMLTFAENPVRELYKFTEEYAEEQRLAAEAREQAQAERMMAYLGWN